MILSRIVLTMIAALILLSGCTIKWKEADENKKPETDIWLTQQKELGSKYAAITDWEERLDDKNTIDYQTEFDGKNVLFKDISFEDVFKRNDKIYVKMNSLFSNSDYFLFILDSETNSDIYNRITQENKNSYSDYGIVVNVKEVTVPDYSLIPNYDGEFSSIEADISTSKIITGTLVDFVKRVDSND